MELMVRKWNKKTEPYDRGKIKRTLQRYGLSQREIEELIPKIEKRLYNRISTKKILKIMDEEIEKSRYRVKKSDLRRALGNMKPAPDFEIYIQRLFKGLGYKVTSNRVIQGHCVTHEIDGTATRDGKLYYIETKHHSNTHNLTPFIDSLAVKAKMDDIKNGYLEGKNEYDFDGAILICNTRLTNHADDYARCVGIEHIGWNNPRGKGIEALIEKARVYPFTILPTLTKKEMKTLSSQNIITIDDLLTVKHSRINEKRLNDLKNLAQQIKE